ncbi:DUF459 domain-containing protein [Psychrobacter sp. FDAARGOS_221]|uniref:SGNH/GDSL hydrolase family protein n=1 Tax=Psychrobacter sp. FDAARGOS_221 TaxID=1975705 RepID=UPI000BB59F94|nr:DUF459 domain-containing protein [Psychrobacter sp. FDAARGOS_221]PNK60048.1 DUF459 domain-containing protein [Psychrobacter sp. FDAARGOS_221]
MSKPNNDAPIKANPVLLTENQKIDDGTQPTESSLALWKLMAILLACMLLVTWFKHDRLTSYWQQTYQQTQVWNTLNKIPSWSKGIFAEKMLNTDGVVSQLASISNQSNEQINQVFYPKLVEQQRLLEIEKAKKLAEAKRVAQLEAERRERERLIVKEVTIRPDQKVFFAGDSMMEGVAPWAMRELQSRYQIASIDLSKQNTGLSYSTFFDWPATIEQTILENPDIGVLAVFLGANDPWAVPDPNNPGGKYIDFATPRWNELYSEKINRIMQAAERNQTQVIWMTPPLMKSEKLKQQMITLSALHKETIPNTKALILDSRPLLLDNPESETYTDSILIDGNKVKVRTADGIHFTSAGQQHLAEAIVSHIRVISDTDKQ